MEGKSNQQLAVHDLADSLDWSESHTSRVISTLQERGFLRTERDSGQKLVSVTDIQPVEQLSDLTSEFEHVDFPNLISGSALNILYYLDDARTATEIAELTSLSRNTVYRRLNELQNVGIVGKDHSQYQLTDSFASLSKLARSIAHHDHRQEALTQTDSVTIMWETHDEYLFSCKTAFTADGFHQTGPAVFEEFGVPLLTRNRFHYLRSPHITEISPADLVCHTLLIDDTTRYRSYCLLLIARHDIKQATLEERAAHYNDEAHIDLVTLTTDLVSYLETKGEARTEMLPQWEDFKHTAADYNISV
jgi:DNA-binding MarR family transcriptional regulator